ncbi:MAG TPA: hypothetical protein VMT67_09925 [Terriglobales bacterium]|nr:hypothetical protein [Terriglobales bacterium]
MFRIDGLGKNSLKSSAILWLAALVIALCVLPACSINVDKKGEKDGAKRVDIQSPVGDLHVSENADIRDTGLDVYPGAKPAPKDNSSDEKSANVNLDLPGFKLKVVAAEFLSDDGVDKIKAYYGKELQKFGKPLECRGSYTNGGHINGNKNDDLQKPVTCDTSSGDGVELKVGTEGNQHIVAVKPDGKGTRFALVYLRMHTGKDDSI